MMQMLAAYILLLGAFWGLFKGPQPSDEVVQTITIEAAKKHLNFLASDSLLGRDTPSQGLEKAGDYIAREFQSFGLKPVNGSYFQYWDMNKVNLGDSNAFRIADAAGQAHEFAIKSEYMPFELTANKSCEGEIVFAGYGISAPELGYDDYADQDVTGKIVLVMRRGPQQENPSSPFYIRKDVSYNQVADKVRIAIENGAAGIMVVTDPIHNRSLKPRGFPWPSLFKGFPTDAVPLTLAKTESKKIPVIHVGEEVINLLFGSVDSLKSLQKSIDDAMTPKTMPLSSFRGFIKTSTKTDKETSRNVLAYLEGRDARLKDELLIIGAHYDHIGYRKKAGADQDSIYNGADDNASGTTGLLQVAEAFTRGKEAPKRSVLFIAFAGEEKGLFGSQFYAEEPLFPRENTIAMLNMDMIGRNSSDSLTIIGRATSRELSRIVEKSKGKSGFATLVNSNQNLRGGSDHAPFVRKGIPVLFFHSEIHDDYHKVSDNPDKINFEKLVKAARFCFITAWQTANLKQRPIFIEVKKPKPQMASSR